MKPAGCEDTLETAPGPLGVGRCDVCRRVTPNLFGVDGRMWLCSWGCADDWGAERVKVAAMVWPLIKGARELQDRMIADILKGETE